MIENEKKEEIPNVQYKFDEKLGILVPLVATDMNVPYKKIDRDQKAKEELQQFSQELAKVTQEKGKTLVKTMGRNIIVEAPQVKLTKYLSGASVMSTRAAKRLIKEGNILVNKKRVYDNVQVSDSDKVEIWTKDGMKYVGKEEARLWVFYKPRGVVCTDSDPQGRVTVLDHLKQSKQILGTEKQLKSMKASKQSKNGDIDFEDLLRLETDKNQNLEVIEHVISVGRLDYNSEGLLRSEERRVGKEC